MRFFALFLLCFVLFSCKDGKKINVVRTNVGDNIEIQRYSDIYFEFDQEIWNQDSLNIDIDEALLEFSPIIKGRYRWTSTNKLVFIPDYQEFKELTDFKVTLTKNILKYKPDLELPDKTTYTFNTGKVVIEDLSYYWDSDDYSKKVFLSLNIIVSKELDLNQKLNNVSVYIDDKEVVTDELYVLNEKEIYCRINSDKLVLGDMTRIKIVINPGLIVGGYSKTVTKSKIESVFNIEMIKDFRVTNTHSETGLENSIITYLFSHSLKNDYDYKPNIKIEPPVDFTLDINRNKMILTGAFEPGTTYKIKLDNNFQSIIGKLAEEDLQYIKISDINKTIEFVESDAVYLPSTGSRNIAVRINDIEDLHINIFKVYENNIMQMFNKGKVYEDFYDEDGNEYFYDKYQNEVYGDLIYTAKINQNELVKSGNTKLLNLNFTNYIKDKGIYILRLVDSSDINYQNDKIVSISDLGIMAKTNNDDLFVSVNSLNSSDPVSGAKVRLISENNQIIDETQTNNDGVAYFRDLSKRKLTKIPKLLRIDKQGDINYLHLSETTFFDNSIFENIDGMESVGYKAFIYGDRELYRPGDSLFISGIVRDDNRKNIKSQPITLKLVLPNSKILKEFVATLDDNGGFDIAYKIPENIITGVFRIKAYSGTGKAIGESKINIEQFMPERIKVTLKTEKDAYKSNDIIKVNAIVENLFGTPAPDRNYDYEIYYRQKPFKNRDLQQYTFDINNIGENLSNSGSGSSDKFGNIKFEIPVTDLNYFGNLEGFLTLSVMDESGNSVRSVKKIPIQTQPHFFGIGKVDNWLNINSSYNIPLIAVNANGNSAGKVKANVTIVRKYWQNTARRSDYSDYIYYESEEKEDIISSREILVDGKNGSINLKPTLSGVYEVRVSYPGSSAYVSYELMAYGSGYTNAGSFKVSKEGYIDIYSELEQYNTGDKAKLLFRTPFNGRLIVTIERNGIIENYNLTTNQKTAELILNIKDEHLPNIYVSAVLVKPVLNSEVPINVAYGCLPIKIIKEATVLPIKITANEKIRSETSQTVKIKTIVQKNINVTVSVVDEGIHRIKNTKTPDPHSFFYEKVALGVKTYDVYRLIFPELKANKLSFGGDGGYDNMIADNFLMNKFADERIKPLAIWSGILKTDANGEVNFKYDVPKFAGSLRISAVAYQNESFGKADTNVIVSDPVIITSGLPRFLACGDETIGLANISNTTSRNLKLSVEVKSNNLVSISNVSESNLSIPANSEKRIKFNVKALSSEGVSDINIKVSGSGENQTEIVKLPIRFPASYTKFYESGYVSANEEKTFDFNSKFENGSSISRVLISRYPVAQFFNGLQFLIDYPYGCMEQIVSKAFPMIYFSDLIKSSQISTDKNLVKDAVKHVNSVIDRAKALQLADGGWALWESGFNSHWWASCYTTHFLITAQRAGYNVDTKIIKKALQNLKNLSGKGEAISYTARHNNIESTKTIYPKEIIYTAFILSLYGEPDYSLMNLYKNRLDNISNDSRILLAAAFKLSGDEVSYKQILRRSNDEFDKFNYYPNNSMSSYIRDIAVSLFAIATANPNDSRIASLTNLLSSQMRNTQNLTTQEAAFGFLALGKVLSLENSGKNVIGYANDGRNEIARLNKSNETITGISRSGKALVKANEGKMYYFISSLGIPKGGKYESKDSYIKVRRTFYNKNGVELSDLNLRSGETVIIKLTVSSTGSSEFKADDMVITDLLPAGFELENPRLMDLTSYPWASSGSQSTHYDYRDDRVNIYFDLSGKSEFYYSVKAAAPGKYLLGPVVANCMYSNDIFSIYGGGNIVNISQR